MRGFLLGTTLFALMTGACSNESANDGSQSDQGPEPTDAEDPPTPEETARDYDEVAQVLAAHARGEFAIMLAAAEISESRMPAGFSLTAPGQGIGTVGSMNYSFTVRCNAGDEAETVVACDGAAHHSHIQIAMTGSQTVGGMAMDEIDRQVDWEIRDLTLDKARFRGPDKVALVSSVTSGAETTSLSLNMDAVYEKVRFMPAASVPTYGTIDFTINVERLRGEDRRVFETVAQLVYGAGDVPTTLTFDGSLRYTVDVKTGAVAKQ